MKTGENLMIGHFHQASFIIDQVSFQIWTKKVGVSFSNLAGNWRVPNLDGFKLGVWQSLNLLGYSNIKQGSVDGR